MPKTPVNSYYHHSYLNILVPPKLCPNKYCPTRITGEEPYFVDLDYEYACSKCGFVIEDNVEREIDRYTLFKNYRACLKKKIVYQKKNYFEKLIKQYNFPFDVKSDLLKLFDIFNRRFEKSIEKTQRKYFFNYRFIIRKFFKILINANIKYFETDNLSKLLKEKNKVKKLQKRSKPMNKKLYNDTVKLIMQENNGKSILL